MTKPEQAKAANDAGSLIDPKRMGGLDGGDGHLFQRAYVLSKIADWISDKTLISMVQEGWSDIELLYTDKARDLIQVKGSTVGLRDLRKILDDFRQREKDTHEKTYREYVIACSQVAGATARLERILSRVRATRMYSKDERSSLLEALASLVETLGLAEFYPAFRDKLRIESGLGWLHSLGQVRRLLTAALVADYGLPQGVAAKACLEIQDVVDSHRGTALEMDRVRGIIEQKRGELVSSDSPFCPVSREMLARFRDQKSPSAFYRGAIPSWHDIADEKDIRRALMPKIVNESETATVARLLIPIVAGGGEGKTTFSMRLAAELAERGHRVLIVKPEVRELPDSSAELVLSTRDESVFLIVDNAARISNLAGFVQGLTSAPIGKRIRLITTCRPYEWRSVSQICRAGFDLLLDDEDKPHSLSVLSRSEVEQLLAKLASENEINEVDPEDLDGVIDICIRSSSGRMLPLVLELTRGERVVEVIRDEIRHIQALGGNLLRAYRYVCLATTLHTSLTEELLVDLVCQDDVLLDVQLNLTGLVEMVGDRIVARHDKIGEIATAELYASAEHALADDVCRMLDLIVDHDAEDVLEDMVRWSFPIHETQLPRVVGKIVETAHSFGREDLVLLALEIFREDRDHESLANELLAVLTPWILDEYVFRFPSRRVEIDFEKLGLSLDQPFYWPSGDSPERGELDSGTEDDVFQNALKWAELYEISATGLSTKPEHERILGTVVGLIYTVLAEVCENRASESLQRYADFIRGEHDWHVARPFYERALELDSENVRAHIGLSVCLYMDGEYEAAIDHYKMAVKLDREAIYDDWRGESLLKELLAGMDEFSELMELVKGTATRSLSQYSSIRAEFERIEPFLNMKKPKTDRERKRREERSRAPSELQNPDEIAAHCDHLKEFLSSISREARIHFFRTGEGMFRSYGDLLTKK